jgi:hypothetical protein
MIDRSPSTLNWVRPGDTEARHRRLPPALMFRLTMVVGHPRVTKRSLAHD